MSIDFRFVTQYLIHSYGIKNVFRYHYSTRVTAVASCQSFLVFSASTVPYVAGDKKWK